jgi:cell division protein FtsB
MIALDNAMIIYTWRYPMHSIKKMLLYSFFSVEILTIVLLYIFGSHGLPALYALQAESKTIMEDIEFLQNDIASLQIQLQEWGHYSYFKEKIAREQLQMAHKDDMIYYISS